MSAKKGRGTPRAAPDYEAYADCLDLLARIHDREADAMFIDGLRETAVCSWLGGVLETGRGRKAAASLGDALAGLPELLDDTDLDTLAAEYADIYLTHAYRISPSGSVWLTEESLERQEPMFEVRKWYRHYGIEVPQWRKRPDDHIVHQLQFVAHLLRLSEDHARGDAARFLDSSLLKWLPDFTARVTERCASTFYQASAMLTAAVVEELRDVLARETGVARPQPEPEKKKRRTVPPPETGRPYVPGQAESW